MKVIGLIGVGIIAYMLYEYFKNNPIPTNTYVPAITPTTNIPTIVTPNTNNSLAYSPPTMVLSPTNLNTIQPVGVMTLNS
jgi:hypothetical protein